jgi:hypothetical protein
MGIYSLTGARSFSEVANEPRLRHTLAMSDFKLPPDIMFNTQKILDPSAFAKERKAASWLYLNGPEFASMEGGMSYEQVEQAVAISANVISDPPRTLSVELAREHVGALDALPRPTLVTCRAGPRSSAVAYMYAGLKAGATPEEVLTRAEKDGAPFCKFDDYKEWVRESMKALAEPSAPVTQISQPPPEE